MARDLLNRSNEFVGIDQRLWIKTETGGYGTAATGGLFPLAADGIEHVNAMIEFNIPREDAAHRSGRSRVVRLSGKKEAKFSYEGYIIPGEPSSGDPTLPDAHPMLLSAFGSVDESDSSKKIYQLTRASTTSFRFLEEGSHFSRLAVGCVADSVTFTLPGDGKAMMKVEGFAQDVYSAGQSAASLQSGTQASGQATITNFANLVSGTPDTIEVAGVVFTAQAGAASLGDATFQAATSNNATASSLATQINAEPTASALVTASALGAVVTITANTPGTGGNSLTLLYTDNDANIGATVTGSGTLAGGVDSGNTITVQTGEGQRFEEGGYIDIIDKDDGSTRKAESRLITDVTGDVITFDGAAVTFDEDDIAIGAAPDFTADSSEDALLGLRGTFETGSFGTLDCDLLSAEISLKNNYTPKSFIYGTDSICGFIADKRRDVSLKLDVLLTKDNYDFYQRNKTFIADSVTITLAPQEIPAPINAADARTFTFRFSKVEFNIPQIEQPGDSYIKLTLEGVALASDINNVNDEFELEIS